MNTQARYPQQMRERAVRLVFEHQDEHDSQVGGHHVRCHQVGDDAEDAQEVGSPGRGSMKVSDRDSPPASLSASSSSRRRTRNSAGPMRSAKQRPLSSGLKLDRRLEELTRFIDERKDEFGVEPMCQVLRIAPSHYYDALSRPSSGRALSDEGLEKEIKRLYDANFQVYGVCKAWKQLRREGKPMARCTVARLMRKMGPRGAVWGKTLKTTKPDTSVQRPADLVDCQFQVPAPNRLWVGEVTYVRTWQGMTYAAFVMDAYFRRVLGGQTSTTLRTDLALDALEMALWTRRKEDLGGVIPHSDRGVQYLSLRYTERLAEAGAVTSVGFRGDSYDNALAESIIGLLQDRTHPKEGALEEPRRRGIRHPGIGRLVQSPLALWTHRLYPAGRTQNMYYRGEVSAEEAGLKRLSLH